MEKTASVTASIIMAFAIFLTSFSCSKSPTKPGPVPTPTPAQPTLISYAYADAPIMNQTLANLNFGACSDLFIGYTAGSSSRVLLNFDISSISNTSTVTSAVLTFVVAASSGTVDISAYKTIQYWSEGTGDCSGTLNGYVPSWNYANGAANTWVAPGGDYDAASQSLSAAISGAGTVNITLNTAMVQAWVANFTQNYGVLLKASNETSGYARIMDRNSGANAPKLTVYYQ